MLSRIIKDAEVYQFFQRAAKSDISIYLCELQKALSKYSNNHSIIPPRIVNSIPSGEAVHLYMPVIDDVYAGVKTLGNNPHSSLGFVGSINVLQPNTGLLLGVFEAKQVTAIRTALASCIGLQKQLPKFRNETVVNCTVFGTGLQAFWHVFSCIQLFRERNNSSKFKVSILFRSSKMDLSGFDEMLNTHDIDVTFDQIPLSDKKKLGDAIATSHVIFGCVPSVEPNLTYDLLAKSDCRVAHTYISLIGSYKPFMHECDIRLVSEFKKQKVPILVDSKEHTLLESGELIDAKVGEGDLVEIGQLSTDPLKEIILKENGRAVSLCKIVGLAIMDICIAKNFMENM